MHHEVSLWMIRGQELQYVLKCVCLLRHLLHLLVHSRGCTELKLRRLVLHEITMMTINLILRWSIYHINLRDELIWDCLKSWSYRRLKVALRYRTGHCLLILLLLLRRLIILDCLSYVRIDTTQFQEINVLIDHIEIIVKFLPDVFGPSQAHKIDF